MKNMHLVTTAWVTAACVALLLSGVGLATADDEPGQEIKERKIKIVASADSEPTVIHVENDLALGETREFVTDDGKTVTVTRSLEDELTVLVDGEELVLPDHDGTRVKVLAHRLGDDDGEMAHKVIVRHLEGEACEGEDCESRRQVRKIIVAGDDDDLDVEVIDLDAEDIEIELDCESEEGDCEAKILELVGGEEGVGEDGKKVVIIEKHIVHEEDHEDGQ